MKRSQGILMPVFSLPSPHGIGTLGKEAYRFIDFLSASGQKYWQLLPMGPTSFGDSPYQSFSTFAGNPYFIDPDILEEEGLLLKGEAASFDSGAEEDRVDYEWLYNTRFTLLHKAFERGFIKHKEEVQEFCTQNPWLNDYALFMSIKGAFGNAALSGFPEALRKRDAKALDEFSLLHEDEIDFWKFVQFLFYRQWDSLRAYARKKEISFIGDLPIYVSMDSADVWAEPENFLLDEELKPKAVAGVPPDAFSDEGQLWGNPLYDYEYMKTDGYGFFIRRIGGAAKLYDVIRIDHFRGFDSYWSIPCGSSSAKCGEWKKGPGIEFVKVITSWFHDIEFIAEDLGIITPSVRELLKESGLPGMKVLEFAFENGEESQYLPHNMCENSICYTGTHDNDTLAGYVRSLSRRDLRFAKRYLGVKSSKELPDALIRQGMMSPSKLFVMQVQDILGLSGKSRINTPGTLGGNWAWRMTKKDSARLWELSHDLLIKTKTYFR